MRRGSRGGGRRGNGVVDNRWGYISELHLWELRSSNSAVIVISGKGGLGPAKGHWVTAERVRSKQAIWRLHH